MFEQSSQPDEYAKPRRATYVFPRDAPPDSSDDNVSGTTPPRASLPESASRQPGGDTREQTKKPCSLSRHCVAAAERAPDDTFIPAGITPREVGGGHMLAGTQYILPRTLYIGRPVIGRTRIERIALANGTSV